MPKGNQTLGRVSELDRNEVYRRKLRVFAAVGDLFKPEEIARCLRKSPTTIRKDLERLRAEKEGGTSGAALPA